MNFPKKIIGKVEYERLGDDTLLIRNIRSKCLNFIVRQECLVDTKARKIVGFSKERNYNRNRCCVVNFSFKEPSVIQEVPISFINHCINKFILPSSIRRIICDNKPNRNLPEIVISENNKHVSLIQNRIIINHHPLEICFYNWRKSQVFIRETVQFIGFGVFGESIRLKSIFLPSSVEIIDDYSFYNCKNLKNVIFKGKSRLRIIGELAFYSTSITSFSFPAGLEEIKELAFYNCEKLISLSFANCIRLNTIGKHAFMSTNIKYVKIPDSGSVPSRTIKNHQEAFLSF